MSPAESADLGREPSAFRKWADTWLEKGRYGGRDLPDENERVEQLLALWREAIPPGWERDVADDQRLFTAARYGRRHKPGVEPEAEYKIEHEILAPSPKDTPTTCLGARLVDGVNALPLSRDAGGKRSGNVEADMLLLVREADDLRLLLVEVKVTSNNVWYAAIENLRQLRLFRGLETGRRLFEKRQPNLRLPNDPPTTGVVLAPTAYYTAVGQKAAALAPTRRLLDSFHAELGVDVVVATWDPGRRAIDPYLD